MEKKAKSLLKISAIYLGTVLGAGFASGQELLLFFVRFSRRGLLGCLLAGVLFCVLGALILGRAQDLSLKTPRKYLETIFSSRWAWFISITMELFLCVSFCVMLSGTGAFFTERFSLPAYVGILITDCLCLFVFLYDVKGLAALNLLLTPFMLLGTLYVCVSAFLGNATMTWLPQLNSGGRFFPYALFYVGYNLLTATAVLVPVGALAPNKKTAMAGGVLGGAALTFMAFICCLAMFYEEGVWHSPMPMLLLSKQGGVLAYYIYSSVIYMAMLTTAVSSGFSILQSLHEIGLPSRLTAVAICLVALPLSFVEFSVLMAHTYVFFGVIGVLLMGGILWDWYRSY
ncbi:MAG: hypothetical protein E7393_02225 [Ruminococcaceae bacterium]|nr:hypothetical protein [Oscillospiraceae bacterium]